MVDLSCDKKYFDTVLTKICKTLNEELKMNSTLHPSFGRVMYSASLAVLCYVATASTSLAQTVIYDGSQQLNIFGAALLTDDLALTNNPTSTAPPRFGVIAAGEDPDALEPGDAAWLFSTLRAIRNTTLGSAGSATGADGAFMSSLVDETGATTSSNDALGHGAAYVLYDAETTTGMQTLNISLYYNDPTPNDINTAVNNTTGGSVAIRVWGIQDTGDANNPWGDDSFAMIAGGAFAGHFFSSASHRPNADEGTNPVVDRLFLAESSLDETEDPPFDPDVILTPSTEWQQLSFQFDAGTGYDYLIFAVGGVVQDSNTLGVDRFGFDNISFQPATSALLGDFDGDGDVDLLDLDEYNQNLDITVADNPDLADLDLDGSGTIDSADFQQHYTDLVETSNGGVGTAAGDINLDGVVNVLGDAFTLVGSLNSSATSWSEGDLNADGIVNVLGDAFLLVGNLGFDNGGAAGTP